MTMFCAFISGLCFGIGVCRRGHVGLGWLFFLAFGALAAQAALLVAIGN